MLTEVGCAKPKKDGALLKRCRAVVSTEQKVKPNHVCFLHKSLKSSLLESQQRAAGICQRTTSLKGHCKSQERNNKTTLYYHCAILCSSLPFLLQKQVSYVSHNTGIPTKVCSLLPLKFNLLAPVVLFQDMLQAKSIKEGGDCLVTWWDINNWWLYLKFKQKKPSCFAVARKM